MRFVRAPTAASDGNGDASAARRSGAAGSRAVGAQVLDRLRQLDRLDGRRTPSAPRSTGDVDRCPKREEADLFMEEVYG